MRKVARTGRQGREPEQWSGVKAKPIAGSRATTTDQTIHTAKASSSAGIDSQRLRRATVGPAFSAQNVGSSGRQSSMTRILPGARRARACPFPAVPGSSSRACPRPRSIRRIERCIQAERDGDDEEQQHEAAGPDAGEVEERAEGDGRDEAAEAADEADEPPTAPTLSG